jgi:azurin
MRTHTIALLVGIATTLAVATGCSKKDDSQAGTAAAATTPPAATTAAVAATVSAAPAPSASAKPAQTVEIQIASLANTMTFDKKTLSVPAGSTVHLTMKNNATMATLPHNWVLVKPGTEASVAAAGLKLGEAAGYFDVRDKDAIAHTDLAKPGATSDVTFDAPAPGDYPYICTFPGHYMMMKGVLTVTP